MDSDMVTEDVLTFMSNIHCACSITPPLCDAPGSPSVTFLFTVSRKRSDISSVWYMPMFTTYQTLGTSCVRSCSMFELARVLVLDASAVGGSASSGIVGAPAEMSGMLPAEISDAEEVSAVGLLEVEPAVELNASVVVVALSVVVVVEVVVVVTWSPFSSVVVTVLTSSAGAISVE